MGMRHLNALVLATVVATVHEPENPNSPRHQRLRDPCRPHGHRGRIKTLARSWAPFVVPYLAERLDTRRGLRPPGRWCWRSASAWAAPRPRLLPRCLTMTSSAAGARSPAWVRLLKADRRTRPRQHPHRPARRRRGAAAWSARRALAGVHIFFPDPWQQKRHHKRRLISPPLWPILCNILNRWLSALRHRLAALC